jgi:Ran GTPase-activating protein (RanGAP) involved in mRNA processing and transport
MDVVTILLEHDVLLGRSPPVYLNEGNRRFRVLVESYRPEYEDEEAPLAAKREIVQRILKEWKERDPPGRFVSVVEDGLSLYVEEDDKVARQKIAQCFRTLRKAAKKAQEAACAKAARKHLGEQDRPQPIPLVVLVPVPGTRYHTPASYLTEVINARNGNGRHTKFGMSLGGSHPDASAAVDPPANEADSDEESAEARCQSSLTSIDSYQDPAVHPHANEADCSSLQDCCEDPTYEWAPASLKRMEQPAKQDTDFELDMDIASDGSLDTRASTVDNGDQPPQGRYSFRCIHSQSALKLPVNSSAEAKSLASELKTNTSLTTLHLVCWTILDDGGAAIADSLATNRTLKVLSIEGTGLAGARIGGDGLSALARFLKTNTSLVELNLLCLALGPVSAAALATSLRKNCTLKKLNLSGNDIGSAGAIAVANAMNSMTLSELRLCGNGIAGPGVSAIADSMRENTTLQMLDLSGNAIGGYGLSILNVSGTTSLEVLTLHNNELGDDDAVALANALKAKFFTALQMLVLMKNTIGDNGALALASALKVNFTLTNLDMDSNRIGHSGRAALSAAWSPRDLETLSLRFQDFRIDDDGGAPAKATETNLGPPTSLNSFSEQKQAILSGMCKKHHGESKLKKTASAYMGQQIQFVCSEIPPALAGNEQSVQPKGKPTHARGLSIFHEITADAVYARSLNSFSEQETALILNTLQGGAYRNSKQAANEQLAASPGVDSQPPEVIEIEDASEVIDDSEQLPSILERFRMICLAFASGIPVNEQEDAFGKSAKAAGLGRCRHPRDLNIDEKVRLYRLAVDHGIPLNSADQAFLQMVNQGN